MQKDPIYFASNSFNPNFGPLQLIERLLTNTWHSGLDTSPRKRRRNARGPFFSVSLRAFVYFVPIWPYLHIMYLYHHCEMNGIWTAVIPSNGRQAWGLRPDDEHLQLSFGPWPSIYTTQPHTAILPTSGGLGNSLWIRYSRIPRTGQESHPDFYEILVLDASWGLSFDAS